MTEITTKTAAKKPAEEKSAKVLCVVMRRCAADGHKSKRGYDGMAEVGEEIEFPRDIARKFQDAGVVKVKI